MASKLCTASGLKLCTMLTELRQWVPNLQQLTKWVGKIRLDKVLVLGGFRKGDFQHRWEKTSVSNPHFKDKMYEISHIGESTGRPRQLEYIYHYRSTDSDGYPRLIVALIRVKFPSLRDEDMNVYVGGDQYQLFLTTSVGTFYIMVAHLMNRDVEKVTSDIWSGIQNQINCQRRDQPRQTSDQLTTALLNTESYRNICKALKVKDL